MLRAPIYLLFLAFSVLTSSASAEILIESITGVSNMKNFISNGNNSSLQIYGGFAGDMVGECASPNGTSTCNNCVASGQTFKSCNLQRAYTTLRFQIKFSSTSITPETSTSRFTPKIETDFQSSTSGSSNITFTASPTEVTGPNQAVTITVLWQALCQNIENTDGALTSGALANCEIPFKTQSFLIGFDSGSDGLGTGEGDDTTNIAITFSRPDAPFSNGLTAASPAADANTCTNGLCNFTLTPGDEKAFLGNVSVKGDTGADAGIDQLVLYCDETSDFAEITQSLPVASVPMTDGQPTENKITGFQNGVTYSCHAALQDNAGNIGSFFNGGTTSCPSSTPSPGTGCRQVTPDNVIGLFSKDTNCFIATAAYGSPMEKHVQMLRAFRNKYLAPSATGRSFVRLYYAVSPPLARWIAQDPHRRSAARALLTPVVWSVSVFMNWSWVLGIAVLFGCGLLTFRRKFL